MAGPSLSGPLTGWTSSTLAPKVVAPPARLTGAAGMKQMNEQSLARQGGIAPDAEGQLLLDEMAKAGAAAGGPTKPKEYHDALYEFIQRNPRVIQSMLNRDIELFARPREGSVARLAEDAKEKAQERKQKAEDKQQARQIKQAKLKETALKDSGAPPPNADAAPPLPGVEQSQQPSASTNPADAELARRTVALKPAKDAEAARVAALTPEQVAAERQTSFDKNLEQFRQFSGGGSASSNGGGGSTSSNSGGGGSNSGSALGPNPRTANPNATPLEQLLSQMFPDAVGAPQDRSGGALNPDLRGPDTSSPFNNIIANLGLSGGGNSGFVQSPGPGYGGGAGGQIASGIPGAPDWLAGQINGLPGGSVPVPVVAPPSRGLDLGGIAALSGEQERQKAEMLKVKAAADAAWFAQLQAQQRAQQQQDQINRQKSGGVISASGWQSPTFKPAAWTPSYPTY